MRLTEMFNICETCVYAPCICGNEPENCIAYVQKNGGDDDAYVTKKDIADALRSDYKLINNAE